MTPTDHESRFADRGLWRSLISENPMLIEIERFRRRFLSVNGGRAVNVTVIVLLSLCYAGLLLAVINLKGELPPIPLIFFQTGLFVLFAPSVMYAAIAGEREKRTWDLLLVAPITKGQIVVGKFFGALAALGIGAALFAIPLLIAAVTYRDTHYWDLLLAQGVSLSFCVLVCAFTLLISARAKRSLSALGVSLGGVFVSLAVLPGLISAVLSVRPGGTSGETMDRIMYLHPFYALGRIAANDTSYRPQDLLPPSLYGVPHILIYLGLSALCIAYAVKTLNYAENDSNELSGLRPGS